MSTPSLRLRQSEAQKNVCRLRNCMPEKFQTLVRMHLSIHLDLDGSKLDEMFSESKPVERTETRQKKSSTPFSRKKSKTYDFKLYVVFVMNCYIISRF